MFNWVFNQFYFLSAGRDYSLGFSISHVTFPEVTSVWGVSAVAILDSSVNCVCMWLRKKLTMPADCVAANCNNSQMTPGVTMHKLPRNRPAVRWKWIKFIQFKRAFLLRRITPICVASTSASAILQTPWNTARGLLWSWHEVPVLFQNPAWQAQTDTAVSLWVSLAKYQFHLQNSSWPFCSDSPEKHSRHMVTWFWASWRHFWYDRKCLFSCIYNPQITVSPTWSFSASFNGNRVKNHP